MWDIDILIELAGAMGKTPGEVQALLDQAQSRARHTALEALDSEGVPPDPLALAMLAEAACDCTITAIQTGTNTRRRTPFNPADLAALLNGRLPPSDVEEYPGWGFVILAGNPVRVEAWLQAQGFTEASNFSPTFVFVRGDENLKS